MRKAVLLITSVLLLNTSFACLNEYHISRRGVSSIDHFAMDDIYFVKDFDKTELEKDLAKLIADSAVNKRSLSYYKNNIAVKLIKLGRNDEAMAILEELYRSNPREYNIVVNLGTLYELLGQNQRALEFIKNAVSLYPGSHHGSEWFHVKVLEYKLKNRKEDQVPGDDILDIRNVKKEISQMAMGVAHQFKERIPFTPVPNLMMAKLLMEYGDLLADSLTIKGAYVIYGIAKEYDTAKVLPLQARIDILKPYFEKYKQKIPDHHRYFVSANEDAGGARKLQLKDFDKLVRKRKKETSKQ